MQTVCAFSGMAVPVLGPPLMERAGLAPESIGLVTATSSIGICWFLACGGPMLSHFGAIRTLQVGTVLMATGLAIMAQPLGVLALVGALGIGFGTGPNTPAGSAILMRTAPPAHRTLVFSIKQAGVPLGGALAGLIVAPLAVAWGLSLALGAIIVLLLACALIVQPFRTLLDGEREPDDPAWVRALFQPAAAVRCIGALRSHPTLPMLTAIGASFSLLQACLTAFIATFAYTRLGFSLAEAGQVVAVMQIASMTGRIVLGGVADRIGHALLHLAVQAFISAGAVFLLVGVGDAGRWALYGCAALVGFTAIGWNGVHMAELARVAPPHLVSAVTSAASLFGFLGSVCGPLAFTFMVGLSGSYGLAFGVMAMQLVVFGLVCLFSLRPRMVR